ncbi:MAG: hypothetical protein E7233_10685 [Lachnospiraceae bacterium]|nr:hypothetical protein [Lachnospiraceae bacterium]
MIPVVVGVTGHRNIPKEYIPEISSAVRAELVKLQNTCPDSVVCMLNSLAEGGDMICADAAEELGIPLIAVLPRDKEDYLNDFEGEARERFLHHCARAEQVFVAPATEEEPAGGSTRSFEFRQAGIYIATHCSMLLALWDGGPGTDAACGSAEAVRFALGEDYYPAAGSAIQPEFRTVIHIRSPRREGAAAGEINILGSPKITRDILSKTDDFNRCAKTIEPDDNSRLPKDAGNDRILMKMDAVSRAAGKLSRKYAERYRLILAMLAVVSSLLTFAFLMYDEAEAVWMILVCGLMLAAAWGCRQYAVRSDCHRRYIEFRALAECLRVQAYLRYAGSAVQAADLLCWTQQEETAWIRNAADVLSVGEEQNVKHDILDCWVIPQRDYHRNAQQRSKKELAASECIVRIALIFSIVLYLAAVIFELTSGGLIFKPLLHPADVNVYRTVLKILLGTISAATLFVANYYGRLSLPRTHSDHQKLERFYNAAIAEIGRCGQTEGVLEQLAREELIENGNWSSYQRDNKPDISL